jgi:hypothetical protein
MCGRQKAPDCYMCAACREVLEEPPPPQPLVLVCLMCSRRVRTPFTMPAPQPGRCTVCRGSQIYDTDEEAAA